MSPVENAVSVPDQSNNQQKDQLRFGDQVQAEIIQQTFSAVSENDRQSRELLSMTAAGATEFLIA